jgi:hypothetical protein
LRNEDRIRLTLVGDDHATIYTDGDELPSLRDADELIETTDAGLVAALGVIGIPMIEHENRNAPPHRSSGSFRATIIEIILSSSSSEQHSA